MVLVSLPLFRLSGIPPHDYWELVVSLRPFLGSHRKVLMNLQEFSSDRNTLCDHVNELLGIWRQVVFMVKHDPQFMYDEFNTNSSIDVLSVEVAKTLFPLHKIHPSLFLFARRMRYIPQSMSRGKETYFHRIVVCMRAARDSAIRKVSSTHTSEEVCMFLCYEAEIDAVDVDISSEVAMNSAWRRFEGWLAADN